MRTDKGREDLRAIDIHRHIYAAAVECDEEVDEEDSDCVTGFTSTVGVFGYHGCFNSDADCATDLEILSFSQ